MEETTAEIERELMEAATQSGTLQIGIQTTSSTPADPGEGSSDRTEAAARPLRAPSPALSWRGQKETVDPLRDVDLADHVFDEDNVLPLSYDTASLPPPPHGTGKNSDPTELRIVLIGGRRGSHCGKSPVGNIILGRDAFDTNTQTNTQTNKGVMKQAVVSGRQVTVVNTPGWRFSFPLDLTPNLTKLEIQQSLNLCHPGPHVFVLVMSLDVTLYEGTAKSAEEHVRFVFGDRMWTHTIVVFTVTNNNKSPLQMADVIRSDDQLRYLTDKCEGRFHVLNITDRRDRSQVTQLLEKIEQMVTSNGCHYETEKHVPEELKEMERTISRRAEQRRADAQKQTTGRPKHMGLTDLRILLLGREWSGKSSAGNLILGGSIFNVSQGGHRSVQCEVRHRAVAGRHVTVVESPGWLYNSPLQNTSEMDKLEIQYSVSLCPPGPHAVLLLVPLNRAFTKAQRVAIVEHMDLLSQRVWSLTIVLFTKGDYLGGTSIEQHIEAEGEDLRWLVDKCGNRYHVFNTKKRDGAQVTELLEKIEEVVAGNRGGHYEVDGDVSEKVSKRKRNVEERVQTSMTRTHRQRTALKALFEGEHQSLPDVRVMLAGGEELQRSRAGNYILQETVFPETPFKEFKTQTKLTECVRQQRPVAERNVSVVICPDWSPQKIKDVLLHGVSLCSPGPHAVLLPVSVQSSFSEADRRSVEEHMELLGDRVWRHALVLFTWGYWLGERCVEEYIESEGEPLRWLLEKCGYRYHVLDFSKLNIPEIKELMEKIEDMVTRNRGHYEPLEMTPFKSLKEKMTDEERNSLEEEWKKREEEMIERMLKFVVKEPEETTLPAARRRRNSMLHNPPSMSGGTPSETGSSSYHRSPTKVSEWLKGHRGPIPSSSGAETMSEAPSLADSDTQEQPMRQWRGPRTRTGTCYRCGQQGHIARNCRAPAVPQHQDMWHGPAQPQFPSSFYPYPY